MKLFTFLRKQFFPNKTEILETARRGINPTPEEADQDRKNAIKMLIVASLFLGLILWLIFSK